MRRGVSFRFACSVSRPLGFRQRFPKLVPFRAEARYTIIERFQRAAIVKTLMHRAEPNLKFRHGRLPAFHVLTDRCKPGAGY